ATTLANLLQAPLVYVRDRPKDHGRQNQVEGVMKENQNVILVEDLVSTGTSSLRALRGLREARGRVHHCLCIFHYGFPEAAEAFAKAQ
ncbi:MAG: orotate phosphoribosyltransferase, partial [Nitrospinaceae bacterium]|nr:orotate phosphoribosyltransferase [Nitrospinaceae bacterium]NIR56472.1 orotate phosphoribosyltransferase [Nitrospinaceae bacterium]NIS86933.1 orotate phosphoribosyltransferase [Nitrospinaceae bacterium]NIT83771.1 orotate phosphoribosyltransferase [Nitrospinaceae bacterium]NIU45974.1 orotate phosphoribosyltransferase [Nitrospinaceae bacterium]